MKKTIIFLLLILATNAHAQFNTSNPVSGNTADEKIRHAILIIKATYGHDVSIDLKNKDLIKFGRNLSVGTTFDTIWFREGNENYLTSNLIDRISSSSAADTGNVRIEGHTISSGLLTFVTQDTTLNGQTPVTLTTALARSSRAQNTGSADWVGNVYIFENTATVNGVPSDITKVHLKTPELAYGVNSSLKASSSISDNDYAIVKSFKCSVNEKVAAFADCSFQVRLRGGVFRTVETISASSSGGTVQYEFDPYVIVPPNSDVRIIATSSASGTDVSASWQSVLAIKQ